MVQGQLDDMRKSVTSTLVVDRTAECDVSMEGTRVLSESPDIDGKLDHPSQDAYLYLPLRPFPN
jgi:DTW domain-containing protein YfiP